MEKCDFIKNIRMEKCDINSKTNKLNEFAGGLCENYVFNQLKTNNLNTYYWTSGNTAEVNFITRIGPDIIPIEAKSNINVKAKSLMVFVNNFKSKYSIRISSKNFSFENNILSIPLYSVFCLNKN